MAAGLLLPVTVASILNALFMHLGEPTWIRELSGVALLLAVPLTPLTIFYGLRILEEQNGVDFPLIGRIFATIVFSVLWFLVAISIFVNVHLSLGGSL